MGKGVAITGMGMVSSIGNSVSENYYHLLREKNGLSLPEILKTKHKHLRVGEIKKTNAEIAEILGLSNKHCFTRAALLGSLALKEALVQAQLINFENCGFISATSVGGIDATEKYYYDYKKNEANRKYIQAQHPGFTTNSMASYFGFKDMVTTISTACSSAANAIMLGARLIAAGKLKRVVVGGTDCLSKYTLNGFNSLLILTPEVCQPFDARREGLNLGEGAAYLVLEAESELDKKTVLGRICGYGNANDAFHQTASSENGQGAFLAMQRALKINNLEQTQKDSLSQIDYINAHGTATLNNDLSESKALRRIFKSEVPLFSSTKCYTGHTLAACGAIEAIFSLLSLQENRIFPTFNFEKPMPETGLVPVYAQKQKEIKTVLSNSFGFAGNCTSLIFCKDE